MQAGAWHLHTRCYRILSLRLCHLTTRVRFCLQEGASQVNTQSYSNITLALLEDSGWYSVDYALGMFLRFGKGKGCDFVSQSCTSPGRKAEC